MALQMQYEDQYGLVHADSYIMVAQIIADNYAGDKQVACKVRIYVNKKSRDDNKAVLFERYYIVVEPDPLNPIVKVNAPSYPDCYTWLKTLPEFLTAIDV